MPKCCKGKTPAWKKPFVLPDGETANPTWLKANLSRAGRSTPLFSTSSSGEDVNTAVVEFSHMLPGSFFQWNAVESADADHSPVVQNASFLAVLSILADGSNKTAGAVYPPRQNAPRFRDGSSKRRQTRLLLASPKPHTPVDVFNPIKNE